MKHVLGYSLGCCNALSSLCLVGRIIWGLHGGLRGRPAVQGMVVIKTGPKL